MSAEYPIDVHGAQLLLLAAKALYWPARELLCVADAHFGKAAAFRALGQPVPHGTTADNLVRLDGLLADYPARQLLFLGDFLHARASHAPATLAALSGWRQRHRGLHCTLVRGNHDRHAGDPPSGLDIELLDEPLLLAPFAFRHIPRAEPGRCVIAGHEHPVYRLQGRGRQRLRLPCFTLTDDTMVLPSFGEFTGGHAVDAAPARRVFVVDGATVWPIPG